MDSRNGNTPREKKPEDFILEAGFKAGNRATLVGGLAFQLFLELWKSTIKDGHPPMGRDEAVANMNICIHVADLWRQEMHSYQIRQAEEIHNAAVGDAAKSKIHLPTWGEIKDHFPNSFGPGGFNHG